MLLCTAGLSTPSQPRSRADGNGAECRCRISDHCRCAEKLQQSGTSVMPEGCAHLTAGVRGRHVVHRLLAVDAGDDGRDVVVLRLRVRRRHRGRDPDRHRRQHRPRRGAAAAAPITQSGGKDVSVERLTMRCVPEGNSSASQTLPASVMPTAYHLAVWLAGRAVRRDSVQQQAVLSVARAECTCRWRAPRPRGRWRRRGRRCRTRSAAARPRAGPGPPAPRSRAPSISTRLCTDVNSISSDRLMQNPHYVARVRPRRY